MDTHLNVKIAAINSLMLRFKAAKLFSSSFYQDSIKFVWMRHGIKLDNMPAQQSACRETSKAAV
ncbi:hypothetical protein DSM101010T_32420 [Desulfovibrio subterraneus]|uniref:Uncharacterized protein n=1 Tax=Desulfovibrio subterraneus TaxID=2718620 RepID=A0A7J0BMC4_9BACT|nr:hypothetical protein DSM101010T_32420 [Desulfovibrio subterraneus]